MLIYLLAIDSPEERSLFEKIYYEYREMLFNVANSYLKSNYDAEDAVHQTFMYAAENMYKFKAGVCPQTLSYLVKTVKCRAIDMLRARKRCAPIDYCEGLPNPDQAVMELSPLASCMNKLPERFRDALILRAHYGYEFREIAKLMGISEANARKIVTRARNKLKEICEKEGVL